MGPALAASVYEEIEKDRERTTSFDNLVNGKELSLDELLSAIREREDRTEFVEPTVHFLKSVADFLEVDGTRTYPHCDEYSTSHIRFKQSEKYPGVVVVVSLPFSRIYEYDLIAVASAYLNIENDSDFKEFKGLLTRYDITETEYTKKEEIPPVIGGLLVDLVNLGLRICRFSPIKYSQGINYSSTRYRFLGRVEYLNLFRDGIGLIERIYRRVELVCKDIATVQSAVDEYRAYRRNHPNTKWIKGIPIESQRGRMITVS